MDKISESTLKFIRRVLGLGVGTHLLTVTIGKVGIELISILGSGKTEVLRKTTKEPGD